MQLKKNKKTRAVKTSNITDGTTVVDQIIHHYHPIMKIIVLPGIYKIMINPQKSSNMSLLPIMEQDVKKVLQALSTEKTTGADMMLVKLVKLVANYLAGPLSQTINNSIKERLFHGNIKVVTVTPVDKKTDNKSFVLNLFLNSILSFSSRVYGNILKTQFTEKLSKLLSLFISAYRGSYNT